MLAVRLMQEQGICVEALNFQTLFTCCRDEAGQAARELGVRLTVVGQDDDYLDLVRNPRFGRGRGANPCVDCRIYMFQRARSFMEQTRCQFVVSGEIVGQRPMSQKRRDLDVIAHHSQLHDLLLRPLSARRLAPTWPERSGLVDRQRLGNFTGRGRKGLIAMAKAFGFRRIPAPSTGCALTEVGFSRKVFDLVLVDEDSQRWDFELLRVGRHYRLDVSTKFIVGRNAEDNDRLRHLFRQPDARRAALISPHGFPGPRTLIAGRIDDHTIRLGGRLLLRHARGSGSEPPRVEVSLRDKTWMMVIEPGDLPDQLANVADAPLTSRHNKRKSK